MHHSKYLEIVTGRAGIFIRTKNVKSLMAAYQEHLGIEFGDTILVEYVALGRKTLHYNSINIQV